MHWVRERVASECGGTLSFSLRRRENEDGSLQKRASSDSVIKIKPIAKREGKEAPLIDEVRLRHEKGRGGEATGMRAKSSLRSALLV